VVTTPQELALVDVVKGLKMFEDMKVGVGVWVWVWMWWVSCDLGRMINSNRHEGTHARTHIYTYEHMHAHSHRHTSQTSYTL
jgi:hypothetical protein